MKNNLKKPQAIFLMGFLASGKDTQAALLEERQGFLRIRSSVIIKNKFKTNPENPEVKIVKEQYYKGLLIEPKTIAKWVIEDVRKKYKSGISIVFSGSPRTLYEAENELPEIVKLYGKDNVKLFFIDISEEEAKKRTIGRLMCDKCKESVRIDKYPNIKLYDKCPIKNCKGKLIKRNLDDLEIFKIRINEYRTRTVPAIHYFKEKIKFYKIDGAKDIESIYQEIIKSL